MPAAAIKGIIISISIITALGVAVLENPQIQAWLEQQRQNVIELLRNLNEELDPQSRRTAEAFAFEGRTVANDPGLRREASGSLEAAAVATGRSLANPSTIRRIPVHGPNDATESEERKRKGREYLAQRNQQMYELKQRKKTISVNVDDTAAPKPPSPTSFDEIVDENGKLKAAESGQLAEDDEEMLAPDPPISLPDVPEDSKTEMTQVDRASREPIMIGEASSSTTGWNIGSHLANPFADEYALDRSETPKPRVPSKVSFAIPERTVIPTMPGSFSPSRPETETVNDNVDDEELSYDEQLAIALSLSEAEAAKAASEAVERLGQPDDEDEDLRAAIEASLKQMAHQPVAETSRSTETQSAQPLVDLSAPDPVAPVPRSASRPHWESFFDQTDSPAHGAFSPVSPRSALDDEDELYRITPQLTKARLASLNSHDLNSPSSTASRPYDPVREAANFVESQVPHSTQPTAVEASFYSAPSSAPSPATTHTLDHEEAQLIGVSEDVQQPERARTPTLTSSHGRSRGFQEDSDSDSATFASVSPIALSRAHSRPRSEVSSVEVIDLDEDSDLDMLSEEGDGIATPDSWTEVGSRDGESEVDDDDERPARQHVHLV